MSLGNPLFSERRLRGGGKYLGERRGSGERQGEGREEKPWLECHICEKNKQKNSRISEDKKGQNCDSLNKNGFH